MQDKVKQFDTFDDFYQWLESEETDVKDGFSEELRLKTQIRRNAIEATRRKMKGKTLDARNKAMEKVSYEDRMRYIYEELHA